jgi:N6-adenosine-specific RNA methylase IME4
MITILRSNSVVLPENLKEYKGKPHHTLLADPPWNETGGGVKGGRRGADRHYPLMRTSDIMALSDGVKAVTDVNSHCYLWVTNSFLKEGLEVLECWGYRYVTNIAWVKDRFGLGQYFRGQHELILFGVRGVLPYKTRADGKRAQHPTVIFAPRQSHSQKPDKTFKMIEHVSHGPYLELFARKQRNNWNCWGNEV